MTECVAPGHGKIWGNEAQVDWVTSMSLLHSVRSRTAEPWSGEGFSWPADPMLPHRCAWWMMQLSACGSASATRRASARQRARAPTAMQQRSVSRCVCIRVRAMDASPSSKIGLQTSPQGKNTWEVTACSAMSLPAGSEQSLSVNCHISLGKLAASSNSVQY